MANQSAEHVEGANAKIVGTPGLIKAVFDYPFHLGLPSIFIPVALDEEGHVALVKTIGREGIQIYDKATLLRGDKNGGVVIEGIPEAIGSKAAEIMGVVVAVAVVFCATLSTLDDGTTGTLGAIIDS